MGNLGEVHPILTTAIRAERATLRAALELARRKAEQNPANLDLDEALTLSPARLERFVACHRCGYRKVDWRGLAEPVPMPARAHEREQAARRALAKWKPSWSDRLFGNDALRHRQLTEKMREAARQDEALFQKACRAAAAQNAEIIAARKLFELDPQAIRDAVAAKTRLAELREPMNRFGVALPGNGRVIAVVEAIQEGDVPHVRLTAGGVREAVAPAERRRIHLAALCSAGLRVGAELVALLPVDAVEVVVATEPAEAPRAEPLPVLQMLVTAAALTEQPWDRAEAVALASALRARLDWSIETGFSPIRRVDLAPGAPVPV
jgi:hypothetical protein